MILRIEKILITLLIVFGLAFSFSNIVSAQNPTCDISNLKIRTTALVPDGGDNNQNNDDEFVVEFMLDGSPPFVYFDVETVGCLDTNTFEDFEISLVERDLGFDDDVNSGPQGFLDDYGIDVPSDTFTLVYLAGEDECGVGGSPDCSYQVETWDADDFLDSDDWEDLIRFGATGQQVLENDGLKYDCDGVCDSDWQYRGMIPYGELDPQDSSGVTPPQNDNNAEDGISDEYLAPLPGLAGQPAGLKGFLQGLFNVAIVVAGILAILMVVIGAITYLSTDSLSGTEHGRDMMLNAVLGLILALSAWVIINTINPELAGGLSITIPKLQVDGPTEEWQGGNAPAGTNIAEDATVNNQPIVQGGPWPSDAAQRQLLQYHGVTVAASGDAAQGDGVADCTEGAGTPNCTSVYFEGPAADVIQNIIDFKNACGCIIKITGGSEAWLHVSHGPTFKVVDMSATESLNAYLRGLPGGPTPGTQFPAGKKITVSGVGVFEAEGSGDNVNTTAQHWHVKFY